MSKPLSGKRAVVIGGSRGIGAAIVKRLAQEGADVAFTYASSPDASQRVVESIAAEGGNSFALQADSADVNALRAAIGAAAERMGGIDILVNNAGVMVRGLVDDISVEDFDRAVNVNVRGMFFAVQAAVKHMSAGGRVINIGSNVARRASVAGASVYVLTKTAIGGLTRGLAQDLAPRGITVNTVQPGPIVTDMNPADSAHAPMLIRLLPVGRMGQGSEVAGLVTYLAGPESGYITGASLTIDGGMSI